MKAPSRAQPKQDIQPVARIGRLGIKVETPPASRESLLRLHTHKKIEQPVVAHVVVADELSYGQPVRETIIALQVLAFELGNGIGLMLNPDLVLHQSCASLKQDTTVPVGAKHGNESAAFQHHSIAALLKKHDSNLPLIIQHLTPVSAQVA